MCYSNALALFTAGSIISAVPIVQATETPACPNGICPGLGHASYLPDTNVLDAKASIGDRAIFRDALLVDAMSGYRSIDSDIQKAFSTYNL